MVLYPHAGRYGPEIFMDERQRLMRLQPIIVKEANTDDLAVLYTDRTKTVVGPNPFFTDIRGNGTFYAEPNEYDIIYAGIEYKVTVYTDFEDLAVGSPGPVGSPGGGWFARYTFSTTTADADPGAGKLRLNNAAQNAATVIRADLAGNDGVDLTSLLDLLDNSTNLVKGSLRIFKDTDATKFIVFSVMSVASPAGYRNITVVPIAWSATTPFANNDSLLITFVESGDKGEQGTGAQPYLWDTSITEADPGTGKVRFNHATPASVTEIYVDDVTNGGVNASSLIAALCSSNAPIKALIELSNIHKDKAYYFNLTDFAHVSSYNTLTVEHLGGSGAFTSGEPVYLSIMRNGDVAEQITQTDYDAGHDPDKWYVIVGP